MTDLHAYWESTHLQELTDEAMALIHERAMARPDPATLIHVPIMGGATAAVAPDDAAFDDRSAPFMLSIDGQTYDPARFDAVRDSVRDTFDAAQQLDGAGGAYLNFSGDQPTDGEVARRQFGGNSTGRERSSGATKTTTSSGSTTTSRQHRDLPDGRSDHVTSSAGHDTQLGARSFRLVSSGGGVARVWVLGLHELVEIAESS